MKLVKISELQIGDEIIISGNSKLKYLKVLSTPALGNKDLYSRIINPQTERLDWVITRKKFKSVRCSVYQEIFKCKDRFGKDKIIKSYVFESDVTKHNHKISIDLSYRDIYLVKREEQKQLF